MIIIAVYPLLTQVHQELHSHWRPCLYNPLKCSSAGEKYPVSNKMGQLLATLCATTGIQWNKPVVTTVYIIDDLTLNTEYAFQVAAVNFNGTSPFSEPITLGGTL